MVELHIFIQFNLNVNLLENILRFRINLKLEIAHGILIFY